jgi:hypothetical protein
LVSILGTFALFGVFLFVKFGSHVYSALEATPFQNYDALEAIFRDTNIMAIVEAYTVQQPFVSFIAAYWCTPHAVKMACEVGRTTCKWNLRRVITVLLWLPVTAMDP